MFDAYAECKGLSFDENIFAVKHLENIAGRVTGSENDGIAIVGVAICCFNAPY